MPDFAICKHGNFYKKNNLNDNFIKNNFFYCFCAKKYFPEKSMRDDFTTLFFYESTPKTMTRSIWGIVIIYEKNIVQYCFCVNQTKQGSSVFISNIICLEEKNRYPSSMHQCIYFVFQTDIVNLLRKTSFMKSRDKKFTYIQLKIC